MMTLEEEALEVLRREREWMDFEGDDEEDESLRYAFIEAASELAQKVAGVKYEYDQSAGKVLLVPNNQEGPASTVS
ncbi:hypothetical protein ADZZY_81 [Mycobacterium phage Adzzy]|uniref:hypothetical protein n=1 Tax=Mycobacterium phage Adzzy TaxID=1383059 RepID=UPI000387F49B|nr:hypothetical protein ADZZY_81 [Mycobacterium phage Adzzy]AGT14329.1 hypothetical protein ADZZY_81 [Mycobacterium phage Adzzy]